MSSFLVLCEGNTRNRWRDGQVCPDVDKELWRLGPDGSGKRGRRSSEKGQKERSEEEDENSPGERTDGRRGEKRREEKTGETDGEKGRSPEIGVKKTMNAGGVENGL
ncbi:hypothetical protein TNCV_4314851 [Trichonephila clavipes]|nr:hypothetical protein TNCV_4314851 [Trichonephila clavipes]